MMESTPFYRKLEKIPLDSPELRNLRVILIRRMLKTMPVIWADLLSANDNPSALVGAWEKLQVWADKSASAGLPFAESLRKIFLDLSPKAFGVIIGQRQETKMIRDAHHCLDYVVRAKADGKRSDALGDYLQKLEVKLTGDHWEFTVPPARRTGNERLRMLIGLIAWQAVFALDEGKMPRGCDRDACLHWFIPYQNQAYCSRYCRVKHWRQKKKSETAKNMPLD